MTSPDRRSLTPLPFDASVGGVQLIWDTRSRVAESPVWDPDRQAVFFSDLRTGRIFRYSVVDGRRESWQLPAGIGSFGLCESGRLVVALERRVVLFDAEDATWEYLTDEIDEPPTNRFNDGKVGPDGAFWVGTRDGRRDAGAVPHGNGVLYRVTSDGTMQPKATGYATPNGLAWTGDGRTMYHSDSHNGIVDAWDFDPLGGELSGRRRFLDLADADGRPDGAACDVENGYWSAGVSAGCLNRFAPDGRLLTKIKMPFLKPSMLCFADGFIYVTAIASDKLPTDIRHRYNVSGLFRFRTTAVGVPVHRFADVCPTGVERTSLAPH
jgi:sugar lactone lactonase YvrE